MANIVKIKRSAVASKIPTTTDLELGELAINTFDGKLFTRKDDGTASIIEIGSGGGGITYSLKTANYTAKDKDGILANTTAGSFTVTLPASPTIGASVVINDAADSFGTNNLIVDRNGSTIETIADNLTLDLSGISVSLVYTGTTWQVYSSVVAAVPAGTYVGQAGAVNTPSYTFTSDLNTGMWSPAADTLAFSANSAEIMRATETTVTINGRTRLSSPNTSAAAWTTTGINLIQSAATFTDTTSTGTVADIRMNRFASQTLAASNAITVSNLYGTYFSNPAGGTNVTVGSAFAVGVDSLLLNGITYASNGGSFNLAQTTNNISIGTSQTTGLLSFGNTAGTSTITLGQSTVSQTTNIQAGATASGSTKTINIGTGGLAGSTTTITIGSNNGTSTSVNGSITASGNITSLTTNGKVILGTDSGGSIAMGKTDGTASSPYIDFNSGATAVDFDTRIAASGGTGTAGQGGLAITAATTSVTGIFSTSLGTVNAPSYTFTGDTNTGMWSPAADTLAFSEGGVEAMRINSSGNVGIGTSTPTFAKFQVANGGVEGFEFLPAVVAGTNRILSYNRTGNAYNTLRLDGAIQEFFTGGSERMRILANGKVGIGTTAPESQLDVVSASGAIALFNSTDTAAGIKSVIIRSSAASGTAIPNLSLSQWRTSFTGNQDVGQIRFDGLTTNSTYTEFASISAGAGTNTTTGAPTDLVFKTSDGLVSAAERMRLTRVGFLGIGTTAPGSRLNVIGHNEFSLGVIAQTSSAQTTFLNHPVAVLGNTDATVGNGLGLRYQIADTGGVARTAGGFGMASTAKDATSVTADMYFYTGTTEKMRITSAGNVGIGTATPGTFLDVQKSQDTSTVIRSVNINAGTSASARVLVENGTTSGGLLMRGTGTTDANLMLLYSNSTTVGMAFNTNAAERMRIDSTGNVGIGTIAPVGRLMIAAADTSNVIGSSTASINITNTDAAAFGRTSNLNFTVDDGNLTSRRLGAISAVYTGFGGGSTEGALAFATQFNGSLNERMRIDSSGNIAVGTTNPGIWRLRIDSGATEKLRLYNTVGNGNTIDFLDQSWQAQIIGTAGNILFNTGGTTERMRIDGTGNVGIGTTAPSARLSIVPTSNPTSATGDLQMTIGEVTNNGGYQLRMGYTSTYQGVINVYSGGAGAELLLNPSGGAVGIGTSSPGAKLEVSSTSAGATIEVLRLNNPGAGANTAAQLKFVAAGSNYGTITGGYGAAAPQMTFNLPAGGNYVWQGTSTEQMRLDTSGNLGIGTTAPGYKLAVVGTLEVTAVKEGVFTITDGVTVNLDPNNGSIQLWTLGASRTPGQANWATGQSITLMIDDGAAYAVTWSTLAVVWKTGGGTAPTLNTSGFTIITLWKVGTTIYGARVGDA